MGLDRIGRAAAGLAALLLAGCSQEEPAESRVVVLGFDGMDPVLLQRWMDQGFLPNFSSLARRGHLQPLPTSNPPQSPVAWSGFATGENPGVHGIYDFLRRDPAQYLPDFSIAEVKPPRRNLELFGYRIPLSDPSIRNRRAETPFWSEIGPSNRASVLRVPVTFPPDPIHRMLSGMGVPDLLGTQGTYTFYTTATAGTVEGGRIVRVPPDDALLSTRLDGPPHPLRPEAPPLSVPLEIRPGKSGGILAVLGSEELELEPGQWSGWVELEFPFGPGLSIDGMVRLHLESGLPDLALYVSPIQFHPHSPAMPLSSPPEYASELADRIGLFHTLGMPEETWSLNAGHLSDAAYLDMIKTILAEREAMFFDTLGRNDSELVVGVFVQTDRVSHMFWRGIDSAHPLHDPGDAVAAGAIRWIYQEADRILGLTLDRLGPEDELIVLSDHGFTHYRRSVHLNRWLIEAGYMTLKPGRRESDTLFAQVDWRRTKAYALGLNSLYINRSGREGRGSVAPEDVSPLKSEIMASLATLRDPESGEVMVRNVYDADQIYPGASAGEVPDLVVGYASGYRASWQTSLGGAPAALVEDNRQKWSGDHLVDAGLVPGVMLTSFPLAEPVAGIENIAALVRSRVDR
ncbi:MAG: alkaline phosphatase family protein [Xanthomonadales bacterium]|nr:alkaline phosphatase family protein [Xanthomonadales bacterium]